MEGFNEYPHTQKHSWNAERTRILQLLVRFALQKSRSLWAEKQLNTYQNTRVFHIYDISTLCNTNTLSNTNKTNGQIKIQTQTEHLYYIKNKQPPLSPVRWFLFCFMVILKMFWIVEVIEWKEEMFGCIRGRRILKSYIFWPVFIVITIMNYS